MAEVVYLVCDESGAKGYHDKAERDPAEVGVIAGFLVPGATLQDVRARLTAIADAFREPGKLHITDLAPERQGQLRARIFASLAEMSRNTPRLIYEAIHQQGFYESGQLVRGLTTKAKASRRSSVAISGRDSKELLHGELFNGLFSKAVAFAVDQFGWGASVKIVVITDRIDEPIGREFESTAARLLHFGEPNAAAVSHR